MRHPILALGSAGALLALTGLAVLSPQDGFLAALHLRGAGAGPAVSSGPKVATTPRRRQLPQAPPTLSMEQRRAFLRYYAPLILKRADEDKSDHQGHDWITNAFFDGDTNLANNKQNWHEHLEDWSDGVGFSHWRLRPTLYTAIIEFMEGHRKSAILLYHVYHAKQRASIHDWERVEIRLDGIVGDPGQGEQISYAVVTEHGRHAARRRGGSEPMSLLRTSQGRHLLVWQAQWSGALGFHRSELRFVSDSVARLIRDMETNRRAVADIGTRRRTDFHYVFVPENDREATSLFDAEPLIQANARRLAARRSRKRIPWREVGRIRYELQDLADLLPTHHDPESWTKRTEIVLSSAVLHEDGSHSIPPSPPGGSTSFLYQALDSEDEGERRNGYPHKHWFWGTYFFDRDRSSDGSWTAAWRSRHGGAVPQHDYFAHNGHRSSGGPDAEESSSGRWLLDRDGWWRPERGGFDGRWVAIFED